MATLARFTKQPGEVLDFDIDFRAWLADRDPDDSVASVTVSADTGITVDSYVLSSGVVKIWLSGGTDKTAYKVTATATTDSGRIKEGEITIMVKEN